MLISPFICSFFFLSNKNLCHRFLSSCWSQSLQILQILYTLRGWPSILCKRNSRCLYLFCLLFQLFFFYHLSFLCNAYGHFPSKISQELLDLGFWNFVQSFDMTSCTRILKFCTKLWYDKLYCVLKNQPHIAYQSLYLFIFLSLKQKFMSQISQLLLKPESSDFAYT